MLEVMKEGTILKKAKVEFQKRTLILGRYRLWIHESSKKSSKKVY